MSVTIDFVAFDDERDACLLVLVEEGPWKGPITDRIRKIQDRFYGCIEAALDGQLAEKFPKSAGKAIVIRLDCYNAPRDQIDEFVERFEQGIRSIPDYSPGNSTWVRSFEFEVNHDTIH